MTHNELVVLAVQELSTFQASAWNDRAFESFKQSLAKAKTTLTEKEVAVVWRDGIEACKVQHPDMHAKWRQLKQQREYDEELIPWEEVKFVGGVSDGDHLTIRLSVKDALCVLEGSDVEFNDPSWVHRKIQFYTRQLVAFPFNKRDRDNWLAGGLFPWIKHPDMKAAQRKTISDLMLETLRAYCQEPIHITSEPDAWLTTAKPVYEDGIYHITFSGFMEFLRKRTGSDQKRAISNFMTAVSVDHGLFRKSHNNVRVRFYRINEQTIYASQLDSGDAGKWEDDDARHESKSGPIQEFQRLDDELREKERRDDALSGEGADGIPF